MHQSVLLTMADTTTANPLMWYLTRTTALTAYVVLTLLVALGQLQSIARTSRQRLPWVVDALHQFLGLLFGVLVGFHLLTLLADPLIPFSFSNILLPLDEPYRPLAVDLGVVALWTMALVLGTSWLRRHLPYRLWRLLHFFSFATFVLVTFHGLLAGSDAGDLKMKALYIGATAIVGFLTLMRLFPTTQETGKAIRR